MSGGLQSSTASPVRAQRAPAGAQRRRHSNRRIGAPGRRSGVAILRWRWLRRDRRAEPLLPTQSAHRRYLTTSRLSGLHTASGGGIQPPPDHLPVMARRKRLRWSPWQRRRPEPGPRRGSLNSHPPSHPLDSKRPAATVSNSLRTPSSVGQGVDTSRTAQTDRQTDRQSGSDLQREIASPRDQHIYVPVRWISPRYQYW